MNAVRASRENSLWAYRRRLWIAAGIALAIHAGIYFTRNESVFIAAQFGDEKESVEVELIERAPEPIVEPPTPVAPEPAPVIPPEPEPVPEPIPEPPKPEPPKPEPPKPEPPKPEPPKPEPKPDEITRNEPEPKPEARPKPAAPPVRVAQPPKPAVRRTAVGETQSGSSTGSSGGATSAVKATFSPAPIYPAESKAAGEKGTTIITAAVDETGRITSVSIKKSSGFSRLDRAAQEAMRRHKLRPATRDGKPIPSSVEKAFRFDLK